MQVLYSSQLGVDVRVVKSYTDLQPVATTEIGACVRRASGLEMFTPGSFVHSHMSRIQESRSKAPLKAIASALKVDLTTLGVFLELHAIGTLRSFHCSKVLFQWRKSHILVGMLHPRLSQRMRRKRRRTLFHYVSLNGIG